MSKTRENYYEMLKIGQKASISEITAAYHLARNAFSKDSLATYSLFEAEDSTSILAELESAYLTLTSPEKRRAYDLELTSGIDASEDSSPANSEAPSVAPKPEKKETETALAENADKSEVETVEVPRAIVSDVPDLNLVQIRESQGLTLSDVSRITKIPTRYLQAIEHYDTPNLPAQVYVQGFLKNLAQLYRRDPQKTVSLYFEQLERKAETTP